jgi:hypothetical protein
LGLPLRPITAGGLIQQIWSFQIAWKLDNNTQQLIPNPHIKLYYAGNVPTQQSVNGHNCLVGTWGDGTTFSIYLPDTGYNPYNNFEFILVPEPATLLLFSLGSVMLRRKK